MLRKIIESPWLYFSLAGALLALMVVLQFEPVAVDAPSGGPEDLTTLRDREKLNVVFIVIDTLRADRLHCYGYERETSPNLDALAARGIRFARVEAQSSWTKSSMVSLWTGLYPEHHGVLKFAHAIPPEAVMPAEIFSEAGYRTVGVWRNGWVANNFGFDQGFDLYVRPKKNRPVGGVKAFNPSASQMQGTDVDGTESAIEFLIGVGDDPFFLYIHYMDVHQYLYADTSPDYGTTFSDIYDSSIHWTDRNVGLLVDALKMQGMLDDTLIVVASDHGEAFYEHGLEGHARALYRETQDVPLIIAPPFALEQAIVVEQRVANVDVWPTILDLVGMPPLPQAEGQSLVPLILAAAGLGEAPEEFSSRTIFSQLDRNWGGKDQEPDPIVAVTREPYRLLHQLRRPARRELYDRDEDPAEKRNVAIKNPEVTNELLQSLDAFFSQEAAPWGEAPEIELDELHKAQLRALGYALPETRGEAVRRRREREEAEAAIAERRRAQRAAAAGAEASADGSEATTPE